MLRWKRWSASWQLTGSQEVFCFLLFFKKSPKSENGTLESRAGWKGLCRKGMMLFFVLVAEKLDRFTQTNYLRDAVCIGSILNEAVSILEMQE